MLLTSFMSVLLKTVNSCGRSVCAPRNRWPFVYTNDKLMSDVSELLHS